ncbi:MAG: hypothetical protein K6T28_06900 [Acidothermus sp.]|nr:hypothetical protein [Acidothermus sp.]
MSLKRKTLTALAALTAVSWIGVILVSVTRDGGVSSRLLGLLPTNLVCAVSSYVILLRYDLPFGESWRSVLPQRRLLNSIVAVYVLGVATAISVVGTPGEAIGFLCGFPLFATASFALAYWTMRRIQQRKDRRESRGEASVGSNGRRRPSPSDVGPGLSQKQTLLLIAIAVTISAVVAMGLLRHSPWQAFAMALLGLLNGVIAFVFLVLQPRWPAVYRRLARASAAVYLVGIAGVFLITLTRTVRIEVLLAWECAMLGVSLALHHLSRRSTTHAPLREQRT